MNLEGGPAAASSSPAPAFSAFAHRALVLAGPGSPGHGAEDRDPHLPYLVRLDRVEPELFAATQRLVGLVGGTVTAVAEDGATRDLTVLAGLRTEQLVAFRTQAMTKSERLLRLAEEIVSVVRAWHLQEFSVRCGPHLLACGPRPLIMGVVNCSPDSFYAGSTRTGDAAVELGLELVAEGADLLDVGGESTRPGSGAVDAARERERVEPVVRRLVAESGAPVSIDTTKADVAAAAVDAGASMVNDISGGAYDPRLVEVVARAGAGLVLMHMRGRPGQMYDEARYDDVVVEVCHELRTALERARDAGVADEQVVLDPGIGFAKRAEHSLAVLNRLAVLRSLGRPILVGPSRKSFIGGVLDLPPEQRLEGTAAAVAVSVHGGAHIVRVHDVRAMRRAADLAAAIRVEGAGWTS